MHKFSATITPTKPELQSKTKAESRGPEFAAKRKTSLISKFILPNLGFWEAF